MKRTIVSDSPSLLEIFQREGFPVALLGNDDTIAASQKILIVPHTLEGWDHEAYSFSFSVHQDRPYEIQQLIKNLNEFFLLEDNDALKKERLAPYLRLLREAAKFLQGATPEKRSELLERIKKLYHEFLPLLSQDQTHQLLPLLLDLDEVKKYLRSLRFYRGTEFSLLKSGEIFLPLDKKEEFYLAAEAVDKNISGEGAALLALLFHFIKDFLILNGDLKLTPERDDDLWEAILQKLETPFVLLGSAGTLLLHHQDFSRLSLTPRECLNLKNGENIERQGQVYSISSQECKGRLLVIFRTEKKKIGNISNRELGVVSSSIAHELNNPLAGMLAALSLLFLEELSSEEHKALMDIKQSIERCKGLVEIFLGFSRMSPHLQTTGVLSQSFSQALNLLRFRMVESNFRLNIDFSKLDSYQHKFNPSIMAMFFYIILSELLTLGQKNALLMSTGSSRQNLLGGTILSEQNVINLQLEQELDLSVLKKSRLLYHLADLLELRLEFSPQNLQIRRL